MQLLREMGGKYSLPLNNICYDGVILSLSQNGLHREAFYFYYEMQHLGLQASRKTYQRLVFAIDNTRDPELSMSCQKKAALLEVVLSRMSENDSMVEIGGRFLNRSFEFPGIQLHLGHRTKRRKWYLV